MLFACNRDITLKPHLHGEDYYAYTLFTKLRENRVSVDIAVFSDNAVKFYGQDNREDAQTIDETLRRYDSFLLHGVSPLRLLGVKLRYKVKLLMLVIFLWNRATSNIFNLRWLAGKTLWQPVIDGYVVTSPTLVKGLRCQGIFRRIYVIPPVYECKYCHSRQNAENQRNRLPQRVKAVYLGSLGPKRFPLVDVIRSLSSDRTRTYELDIYTTTQTPQKTFRIGNVEVNLYNQILSDEEKCRVLRESHLFIAPRDGTTMNPSMSIMEAEYHGITVARI